MSRAGALGFDGWAAAGVEPPPAPVRVADGRPPASPCPACGSRLWCSEPAVSPAWWCVACRHAEPGWTFRDPEEDAATAEAETHSASDGRNAAEKNARADGPRAVPTRRTTEARR
jgi:hypothetical protein